VITYTWPATPCLGSCGVVAARQQHLPEQKEGWQNNKKMSAFLTMIENMPSTCYDSSEFGWHERIRLFIQDS
jgi:hypothetical protein